MQKFETEIMETETPAITVNNDYIHINTDAEIDAKDLNEALLTLPAKTYLGLYHKMQEKVVGYSYFGACGATISEEETE